MRTVNIIIVALCAVILSENVNAYRILAIFPHVSRSHYIVGESLMKGLAAKGHEVTMISPYKQSKPIKNYRDIHLEHTVSDAKKGIKLEGKI